MDALSCRCSSYLYRRDDAAAHDLITWVSSPTKKDQQDYVIVLQSGQRLSCMHRQNFSWRDIRDSAEEEVAFPTTVYYFPLPFLQSSLDPSKLKPLSPTSMNLGRVSWCSVLQSSSSSPESSFSRPSSQLGSFGLHASPCFFLKRPQASLRLYVV